LSRVRCRFPKTSITRWSSGDVVVFAATAAGARDDGTDHRRDKSAAVAIKAAAVPLVVRAVNAPPPEDADRDKSLLAPPPWAEFPYLSQMFCNRHG